MAVCASRGGHSRFHTCTHLAVAKADKHNTRCIILVVQSSYQAFKYELLSQIITMLNTSRCCHCDKIPMHSLLVILCLMQPPQARYLPCPACYSCPHHLMLSPTWHYDKKQTKRTKHWGDYPRRPNSHHPHWPHPDASPRSA